jgi:hypothetical protein
VALRKFAEPSNSKTVFFRSYLPETDNPFGALYAYDISANQFTFMKVNADFAGWGNPSFVSVDQTKFAFIPEGDVDGLNQKMFLIDLQKDTYRLLVQLSGNETFNAGYNVITSSFDLRWIDENTLEYPVYDQSKKQQEGYDVESKAALIENRRVTIN